MNVLNTSEYETECEGGTCIDASHMMVVVLVFSKEVSEPVLPPSLELNPLVVLLLVVWLNSSFFVTLKPYVFDPETPNEALAPSPAAIPISSCAVILQLPVKDNPLVLVESVPNEYSFDVVSSHVLCSEKDTDVVLDVS